MQTIYPALIAAHGIAGLLALVTYWIAGFARKGSALHVGSGRVYLFAMLGICATAVPMSIASFLLDKPGIGTFLAYLVVITATSMWLGLRAIRMKRSQSGFRNRSYAVVGGFNLLVALTVLVVGLNMGNALLMGFSAVGMLLGGGMLRRLARPIDARNWWLQEHYAAMLGCGVATHIAFLSIGLNRLVQAAGWSLPSSFNLLAWFAPVAVAVVAGILLDRKYAKPKPASTAVSLERQA